jgi:hypothetical protein
MLSLRSLHFESFIERFDLVAEPFIDPIAEQLSKDQGYSSSGAYAIVDRDQQRRCIASPDLSLQLFEDQVFDLDR